MRPIRPPSPGDAWARNKARVSRAAISRSQTTVRQPSSRSNMKFAIFGTINVFSSSPYYTPREHSVITRVTVTVRKQASG